MRGVSICHLAQEILTPQMARKADTSVSPPALPPNLRQRLVTSPWLAVRWGLGAGDWLVSPLSRARLRVADRPAGARPTSVPRFVYVVPFSHDPACLWSQLQVSCQDKAIAGEGPPVGHGGLLFQAHVLTLAGPAGLSSPDPQGPALPGSWA